MSDWTRFAKPSWWTFHWKHRNVAQFWWRYFRTRPFPDNFQSVDEVVEFGKRHQVMGFNRECIRSYIIWRLHRDRDCTSFVETGTFYGHTSAYVKRAFRTPVFTTEIVRTHYLVSKANLIWAGGIQKSLSASPDFLNRVCEPSIIGNNPMFYLDAHWQDHVPLLDELRIIADRCERATIVIDDFMIPWEPKFLYDEYPSLRFDLDAIKTAFQSRREDVTVYLPTYRPGQDPTGKGIGFAVALLGQDRELSSETFPYDLLSKAPI